MAEKKLSGAGLRGQVAGETALCTVGKTGTGLTYRGYDISELAEKAKFEEGQIKQISKCCTWTSRSKGCSM